MSYTYSRTSRERLETCHPDIQTIWNEVIKWIDASVFCGHRGEEAQNEASQIIAKAREATELEREQMLATLKRDFGRLVIDTTSKATGKVLSDEDQERINQETIAQVSRAGCCRARP